MVVAWVEADVHAGDQSGGDRGGEIRVMVVMVTP